MLKKYIIVNEGTSAVRIKEELEKGVAFVQFRPVTLGGHILKAIRIRQLVSMYKVPFIINNSPESVLAVNADGVHLGQSDTPIQRAKEILGGSRIIGATAKNLEQALSARNAGATYLGCGCIFSSKTKPDAEPMTIDTLKEICRAVAIPVYAIGGITDENMGQLEGIGLAGVAYSLKM
jgi:thiamine-phosphate pyrophosphorylase